MYYIYTVMEYTGKQFDVSELNMGFKMFTSPCNGRVIVIEWKVLSTIGLFGVLFARLRF